MYIHKSILYRESFSSIRVLEGSEPPKRAVLKEADYRPKEPTPNP